MKKVVLIAALALAFISVCFISACAGAPSNATESAPQAVDNSAMPTPAPSMPEMENGEGLSGGLIVPDTSRKIILRQNFDIETKDYDGDMAAISAALKEAGGYIESSSLSGRKPQSMNDLGRTAQMTFRVPQESAERFVDKVSQVGVVISSSSSGEDVTEQYTDVELRLKTLRTRYDRLLSMMEKAVKTEDIIALERELADVTYEIESLEASKRSLDNLVQYVTVNVNLYELNPIVGVNAKTEEQSLGERISSGFYSVFNAFVSFLEGFAVVLVSSLPIVIPLGVIAVVIILLVKRSRKKKGLAAPGPNAEPQDGQGDKKE